MRLTSDQLKFRSFTLLEVKQETHFGNTGESKAALGLLSNLVVTLAYQMEGAGRRQGPVDIDRREQVHRWSKAMDVIAKPIYEGPRLTVFVSYGED